VIEQSDLSSLHIPEPDAIRAAIDAADERARLLRRLLRVALRLRSPQEPSSRAQMAAAEEMAVSNAAR
jgi:hypothetical protein